MSFEKKNFQEIRDTILDEIVDRGLITDRNVGSVTRTLSEAYARELAVIHESMEKVYESAFVDTAEGKSLDYVVSILGISRINATQALGIASFSRKTPAPGDITISKGTILTARRNEQKKEISPFETLVTKTLQKGQTEIEIPIRAQQIGETGIADKHVLTLLPRPIVGIENVTNPEPTVLRRRDESDDELRERAKNALRNTGKATHDALDFAIRQLGAQSVKIIDCPFGRAGEIDIIVDGSALDDMAQAQKITNIINETKAAGIKANLQVTSQIHIFIKLRLALKNKVIIQEELDAILENVASNIETYVNSLELGETVLKNGIVSAALSNPDVLDVTFLPVDIKAPDILIRTGFIKNGKREYEDIKQNRKRVIAQGDIFLGQVERASLDRKTDLIANQDILVKERKFPVFLDCEDTNLVLESTDTLSQNQIIDTIKNNLTGFIERINNRINEEERPYILDYDTLLHLLQIETSVIQQSKLQLVLLHTFDGLENRLTLSGQRDTIKINEALALRYFDIQVNLITG